MEPHKYCLNMLDVFLSGLTVDDDVIKVCLCKVIQEQQEGVIHVVLI